MSTPEGRSQHLGRAFRAWFRSPPRAHGDVIEHRVVSFLELFYDLVFVVLIGQLAHALAGNVSWAGIADYVVVFGLVGLAWVNGSLYHELHGRDDGRNRTYVFGQMLLLVLLAVFAGGAATTSDGRAFAVIDAMLLALLGLQWWGVRRQDTAEFASLTQRYVIGIALVATVVAASALVDDPATRVVVWAGAVVLAVVDFLVQMIRRRDVLAAAFVITESMAERLGLFVIIVLGEVVVGVADGLAAADRDARTITVGLLALTIGFGFWWNYFDFAGRRIPRPGTVVGGTWLYAHFPLTMAIAATGAGMVSLVEHAGTCWTPAATAWLIGGATAGVALGLAALVATLPADPVRRRLPVTLVIGAAAALVLAALRPGPILLAAGLVLVLAVVWTDGFVRAVRCGDRRLTRGRSCGGARSARGGAEWGRPDGQPHSIPDLGVSERWPVPVRTGSG